MKKTVITGIKKKKEPNDIISKFEKIKKESHYYEIRNKLWSALAGLNTFSETEYFKVFFDHVNTFLKPSRVVVYEVHENDIVNIPDLTFLYLPSKFNKVAINFPAGFLLKSIKEYEFVLLNNDNIGEKLCFTEFPDLKKTIMNIIKKNDIVQVLAIPFKVNSIVEKLIIYDWSSIQRTLLEEVDIYNCVELSKILSMNISKFRTQTELKYSEETSLALIDAINDWAVLIDTEGRLLAVNSIVCDRLGVSKKELIGKDVFQYFPIELVSSRKKIAELVKKLKKPISFEEAHKINSYYITICPVIDNNNNIIRLAVYAHDITGYKTAVKAAMDSEDKLRTLLENSSDGIIIVDRDFNVIFATESACNIVGYKLNEAIGRSALEFIHPDDLKNIMENLARGFLEPSFKDPVELRCIRKDGQIRYLEGRGNNLFDNPYVGGYVINFRDITERKNAEIDLNLYKYIVSASSDQMIFIDSAYTILAVNDPFLKAFGQSFDNIKNKKLSEIYGENEFETFFKNRCEQCLLGVEVKIEKWFVYPAIGKKLMDITLYPYYSSQNKKISGIVINARDISERFEMENEMVDIQEKEQKRIGMELHDGLNHNLLNIAIRSRILGIKLEKKAIEESREAFEIEALVNKSMEESKNIASGLFPVNIDKRGLKELIEDIISNVLNSVNIEIKLLWEESIPEIKSLKALVQFYYILNEAVRNIIKHSKADNVIIKCYKDKKHLCISIIDDGVGLKIPENSKGMGISLMAYRARIIGGSIDINNRKGNRGVELICKVNLDTLMNMIE